MLTLYKTSTNAVPLQIEDYYIREIASGLDELVFKISIWDEAFPYMQEETLIREQSSEASAPFSLNNYRIKAIDAGEKTATVKCVVDISDWKKTAITKLTVESLTPYQIIAKVNTDAAVGWTVINDSGITTTASFEMEYAIPAEVFDKVRELFPQIGFRFDAVNRSVSVANVDGGANLGAFITRELNLKKSNYKGKSTGIITRLYATGKDGITFASVNSGLPYIDNHNYTSRTICGYVQFDDIEDPTELLNAALAYLDTVYAPVRSYDLDVADLYAIDPDNYDYLRFPLFSKAILIDETRSGAKIVHRVIERWRYPYIPTKNKIVLSTSPARIQAQVASLSRGGGSTSGGGSGGGTPSASLPLMDGEAAVGTESTWARGDHVHPSDTTKLDVTTRGAAGGVATLDSTGKVPLSQLPAGSAQNVYYGTCSTAAGTTYKQITVTGLDSYDDIVAGIVLVVRCTTANTVEPYLMINDISLPFQVNVSGASGTMDDSDYTWDAGAVVEFYCTGSAFLMLPHASATGWGLTKLYSGIDSTSNKLAASAGAVRTAYSLAEGAFAAGDFYGVCSTAGATAAKVVTVDSRVTELYAGLTVTVKFNYAQLYDGTPTLNVNDLGQRYIMRRYYTSGQQEAAGLNEWQAGEVLQLAYNGTYWVIVGGARRGGSSFTTLWTNSAPSSAFANQTVSISGLSDYDAVVIEYTYYCSTQNRDRSSVMGLYAANKSLHLGMNFGNQYGAYRDAVLNASSITFSSGYDYEETADNDLIIPTAVIGIKF